MMKLWIVCLVAIAALFSSTFGQPIECNGPNEEYACGSACDTQCDSLGVPCPYVNIKCNEGCYCIPGYARDSTGRCIPISSCKSIGSRRNAPFLRRSRIIPY